MGIKDAERSILTNEENERIRRANVFKENFQRRAEKLFGELCYYIAQSRIGIRNGGGGYMPTDEDCAWPVYLLQGKYKATYHSIEYLVKTNINDFFNESSHQTFMDKLLTSNVYHKKRHMNYTSNDKWIWFTDVFNALMKKEGIGYEWLYLREKSGSKSFMSSASILTENNECIHLPSTGACSFETSNNGYDSFGNVYIHLWYDV